MDDYYKEFYHIYPEGDLKEHILEGDGCWCIPDVDHEGLIIHNSADGREKYEVIN